jgi:ketosteroid isomerase-like protein
VNERESAMAEEAVEVIRAAFEEASRVKDPSGRAVAALDPETLAVVFDFFDPEIELQEDPSFPEAGIYRGIEAVRRYFDQFTESFDEFTVEAEDYVELADGRVLMLFRLRTRGKESGATVTAHPGWIYTIRGRKAVRIEAYLDRDEAFAAGGLAKGS